MWKQMRGVTIVTALLVGVILAFGYICNAGNFNYDELDVELIDLENPVRAKQYVESCGVITGTVTSIRVDPTTVSIDISDSGCESKDYALDNYTWDHCYKWTVILTENDAARLSIGDQVSFHGKIDYKYRTIGTSMFWCYAQLMEVK